MTFTGTVGSINAALDGLRFDPAAGFNGPTIVQIVTSDQGNTGSGGPLRTTSNVVITVAAVNDAPAGTNNAVTTLEDTSYTFTTADFGFTDPNDSPANSLFAVRITTLPGAGTLTDNGVAVTAGQFVSAVDIGAGLLVFAPSANANGAGYASFTFQVQDNGVGESDFTRALTIDVSAVNDAPANSVPDPQLILQDRRSSLRHQRQPDRHCRRRCRYQRRCGFLSASNGVLTLSQITNLLFVAGDGATTRQ
jgi:hypothetical protein